MFRFLQTQIIVTQSIVKWKQITITFCKVTEIEWTCKTCFASHFKQKNKFIHSYLFIHWHFFIYYRKVWTDCSYCTSRQNIILWIYLLILFISYIYYFVNIYILWRHSCVCMDIGESCQRLYLYIRLYRLNDARNEHLIYVFNRIYYAFSNSVMWIIHIWPSNLVL